MKPYLLILLLAFSTFSYAGNIGLGQVVAVKQYDFSGNKTVKIYLDSSSSHVNSQCVENYRPVGTLTHAKHDADTISRMFSLATAAYMSGKKVRLYSSVNTCEVDLVALQEEQF